VPTFLVEMYMPRLRAGEVEKAAERARAAAAALRRSGSDVCYLRLIFVPDDETCFHLFEAASAETVRVAGHFAGLAFDRVTEAVESVNSEGGER
jgi:hypothetical protein